MPPPSSTLQVILFRVLLVAGNNRENSWQNFFENNSCIRLEVVL